MKSLMVIPLLAAGLGACVTDQEARLNEPMPIAPVVIPAPTPPPISPQ
jgi:hypothetical protein